MPRLLATAIPALLIISATRPHAIHAQLTHEGPAKATALAQTVPPYDVVTVKLNHTGDGSSGLGIHGDSLTATNASLSMLIDFAFDVKDNLVTGLTGPASSAHFDLQAKILPGEDGVPRKINGNQMRAMMIELLNDRFHLKAHVETKTLPVYNLVVARGGPRMKFSQDERAENNWNQQDTGSDKVLTAKSATMDDLAEALSDEVQRQVINKTSLTGSADITLKWADDVAAEQGGPNVISVFTAIQDQLGLKLESAKGPVDTLVIDHVEMPAEN